ncbi:transposase [Gimesia maris]|uniref:transposase n=1 Tax=Gimesia maris TaxID=122 RepID=UPI0012B9A195|nr:transposase [Gimesia maris]
MTDKQWSLVANLFPWTPPSKKGGRPKAHPRDCLEGILWILVTGARWKDLPKEYPSKATCHRRFQQWTIEGRLLSAWQIILERMDDAGQIDFSETFADGTFASAKKGVEELARLVVAKALKS